MALGGILLGLATSYGLPILTKILQGDKQGAVETVIKSVATELGVTPTEQDIKDYADTNPEGFSEVIHKVEDDFSAMAEAAASATKNYHEILMVDQNSEGLLARTWRPFNGFMFALECAALVASFVYCMVTGKVESITAATAAFGFLGTVLTAHAGVVGVYTWKRTTEKTARIGER